MTRPNAELYDPQRIKSLFDEIAGTYGWVNFRVDVSQRSRQNLRLSGQGDSSGTSSGIPSNPPAPIWW